MNNPTKAMKEEKNPYFMARKHAAKYNDQLNSYTVAAEIACVERSRLSKIENDVLIPHADEVIMLAETYKAPELLNYHCSECCPIGKRTMQRADEKSFEAIGIQTYAALKVLSQQQDSLMMMLADGKITDDEIPELRKVLQSFDTIAKLRIELQNALAKAGVGI